MHRVNTVAEWVLMILLLGKVTNCTKEPNEKKVICGNRTDNFGKYEVKYTLVCSDSGKNELFNVHADMNNSYWTDIRIDCKVETKNMWDNIKNEIAKKNFGRSEKMQITNCLELPEGETYGTMLDFARVPSVEHLKVTVGGKLTHKIGRIEGLEFLIFKQTDLSEVPVDFLEDNRDLVALEVEGTGLEPKLGMFTCNKLHQLNLGGNKIRSLPDGLFKNLTHLTRLELWDNLLVELGPDVFEGMSRLQVLDLHDNQISNLRPEAFKHLLGLKEVKLHENLLSSLPEGLLSNFSNLMIVRLNQNNVTELPEDLLAGSSNLVELYLQDNQLCNAKDRLKRDSEGLSQDIHKNRTCQLPLNIFNGLTKLTRLDLSYNQLQTIPRELFESLVSLEDLKLSYNRIEEVENHAFQHTNLQNVSINGNNLTELFLDGDETQRSVFKDCPKLEVLQLSQNRLKHIYTDWTNNLPLRILNLSQNHYTSLKFDDLMNIKTDIKIDLTNNRIRVVKGLKASTKNISNNITVQLSGNEISCDCNTLGFAEFLRKGSKHNLEIEGAQCNGQDMNGVRLEDFCCKRDCTELCDCWTCPSGRVLRVNCSGRNLSTVPESIDSQLDRVELDLTNNLIKELPSVPGSGYDHVSHLFLSHNRISSVKGTSFMKRLQVLKLDHNKLERVEDSMVEYLRNSTTLQKLSLDGNPLICDCGSLNLTHLLASNISKYDMNQNTTCKGSTKLLVKMTANELCSEEEGHYVLLSTLIVLYLLVLITAPVYCKYQYEIKVWLFAHNICLPCVTRRDTSKPKRYHAFISFSHEDNDYVIEKLVPGLQEFNLCLHYRDWEVGDLIMNSIARSVSESRRTIIVLSPAFLTSEWGRLEFRTAHLQALRERTQHVLMIVYGDVGPKEQLDPELQAYINKYTYLSWDDPNFWNKLKYALYQPTHSRMARAI